MPKLGYLLFLCLGLLTPIVGVSQSQGNELTGTITNDKPFVEIPVHLTEPNRTITLDMQATSGDLDTLLYLIDANGLIVAQNDDRQRGDTDSLIVYPLASSGDYTVVATRYKVDQGDTTGDFTLTVSITDNNLEAQPPYTVTDADLTAAGFPIFDAHPIADWTVLVYYGGDNNLEPDLLTDLDEFELGGGGDAQTNVIVLMGRSPDYTTANGNWTDVRLFDVSADITGDHRAEFPPTVDTPALAILGDQDTSSGQTLAQFLVWGLRHYPARHYAVAFGSHGAGWEGLIVDESSAKPKPILSINDLQHAFDVVTQSTGVDHFDLLINDACLMSSVEYYSVMSRYFQLSIASPEIVMNPALDMSLLTDALRTDPDLDLQQLGTQLVDTYIQRDTVNNQNHPYLASAITDLTRFNAVTQALNRFADVINSNPHSYASLLGQARANAYTYTTFLGDSSRIDVGYLMQQVVLLSDDLTLVNAATNVIQALEDAKLYGNAGERVAAITSYYNIYFPAESRQFNAAYLTSQSLIQWGAMLQNYFAAVSPTFWRGSDSVNVFHPSVVPTLHVTRIDEGDSSSISPPSVMMEVTGRNVTNGTFTVDQHQADGSRVRLKMVDILTEAAQGNRVTYVNAWNPGIDQSYFSWIPLQLPVVTDGRVSAPELLTLSGEQAVLSGRYRNTPDTVWTDALVVFNLDGTVQNVVSRGSQIDALGVFQMMPSAEFQAYRMVVNSDGTTVPQPGTEYVWGSNGLQWQMAPAPSGIYDLGFVVESAGGISAFDTIQVDVDNSRNLADYEGYVDPFLGINFQYPLSWSIPADTGRQIFSLSPDGDIRISVNYGFSSSDLAAIVQESGITLLQAPMASMIQGTDALEFEGTSNTTDGTTWQGLGFAIPLHNGTGAVIVVETRDASTSINELYTHLRDTFTLFDPITTTLQNRWTYRRLHQNIAFPIPANWVEINSSDIRKTYASESNPLTQIQVSEFAEGNTLTLDQLVEQELTSLVSLDVANPFVYNGQNHHWDVLSYVYESGATPMVGRLYLTTVGSSAYSVRVETPDSDTGLATFRDVFELAIDGFAPPRRLPIASGSNSDSYTKAAILQSDDACAMLSVNELCYGTGRVSAVFSTLTPQRFAAAGDTVSLSDVVTLAVGYNDDGVVADNYSVAQLNLGGIRISAFGGATLVVDEPMSLQILYDQDVSVPALGVLLQSPSTNTVQNLTLNGINFQIAPGTTFLWQGDLTQLETQAPDISGDADVINRRRPAAWTAAVLDGAVRVSIPENNSQKRSSTMTANLDERAISLAAGISVSVSPRNGRLITQIIPLPNQGLADAISTSEIDGELPPFVSDAQASEWEALQPMLELLDITSIDDSFALIYPYDNSDAYLFSEVEFSQEDFITYFMDQTGYSVGELADLLDLSGDPALNDLLSGLGYIAPDSETANPEEATDAGTNEDGTVDSGSDNSGALDTGSADGGAPDGGAVDGGAADNGGTDDGSTDGG